MDCYCDYDEPYRLYAKTERKARKVHVCRECHCRIQPGEKYEHVTGIADAVEVFKTCARCIALRDWVEAHVPCFCWQHDEMVSAAIETCQHYAHEAPGLLFGAYRRQVLIKRAAAASRANH
jgi:hypothetical protein